jgi:hypothetical protein
VAPWFTVEITLTFSTITVKLIISFLSERTQSFGRRWDVCTQRDTSMGATRFRPIPSVVQSVYKWCPLNPDVYLTLFADDAFMYATDREDFVIRKLQRGLNSCESWCERWNIKVIEDKRQAMCFINVDRLKLILHWMDGPFLLLSL